MFVLKCLLSVYQTYSLGQIVLENTKNMKS